MPPYCALAASSLLNVFAYLAAFAFVAVIALLVFAALVVVKMPRDAQWAEVRLGRLVARWGRSRRRRR